MIILQQSACYIVVVKDKDAHGEWQEKARLFSSPPARPSPWMVSYIEKAIPHVLQVGGSITVYAVNLHEQSVKLVQLHARFGDRIMGIDFAQSADQSVCSVVQQPDLVCSEESPTPPLP